MQSSLSAASSTLEYNTYDARSALSPYDLAESRAALSCYYPDSQDMLSTTSSELRTLSLMSLDWSQRRLNSEFFNHPLALNDETNAK